MADGTITIDGRQIPFEEGDTIIKAAHRAGIDIPHYCWHPGLSSPANCRMCLVEIEPPPGRPAMMLDILDWDAEAGEYIDAKKPKLMPACQMNCADGMVVRSDTSEHVAAARRAVQEMLLLNHPVDCPICDQAGECSLQDYWLEHSRAKKRKLDEPVHKVKAEVFGEKIVYDGERCIVCSRCIRVCKEVAGDPVLSMRERGNLKEVVLSPGRELDHPYSLMTEHVCPVGALTTRDFRFKARVWFLRTGRTICQGCATGCNAHLDYDPRDNTPYRYRPRDNPEVNEYWMCDDGMLSYVEAYQGRLLTARVGGDDATLQEALDAAKRQLKGHVDDPSRVAVVLSANHCNEDNFALALVASQYMGVEQAYLACRPEGEGDDVLMSADKNSNAAGVKQISELLGLGEPQPMSALIEALAAERYSYVISLGSWIDVGDSEAKSELSRLKGYVALCSHKCALSTAAHIALPACAWAETVGNYVNRDGMAQHADAVLAPRGDAHPAWQLAIALGRALGYEIDINSRADLVQAVLEKEAGGVSAAPDGADAEAADDSQAGKEVEA